MSANVADRQLAILAGGQGTRLRGVLGDLPKPMADICGKPLLERQIDLAVRYGFLRVTLLTSYRSRIISDYFGDGSRWGIHLDYLVDENSLGTAGAVLAGLGQFCENFILLYGDVVLDVQLETLWKKHLASGADATLLVHPNDHPQDSDLVEADSSGFIRAFHGYPHPKNVCYRNLVNAGLYVLKRSALEAWKKPGATGDFGKWLFPAMIAEGSRLLAYRSREYIKDMGTPARLEKVTRHFACGKVTARNFDHPSPAVFLDRDGTLNREVNWLSDPGQIALLPGAAQAIRSLNSSGWLAVLVTNQPVIARGECSEEDLEKIHARLEFLLGLEGAYLDAIYYCPHHPDKGFPNERTDLKIACTCRKPATGMIDLAARELNIDLSKSWFIGDTTTDMETARRAGLRSVLVETGHAGKDEKFDAPPAHVAPDLHEAVRLIEAKVFAESGN
jgi:histidinol-phosphate phosphatase family protein